VAGARLLLRQLRVKPGQLRLGHVHARERRVRRAVRAVRACQRVVQARRCTEPQPLELGLAARQSGAVTSL
jgi:hypothetical protein